MKRKTFSMSSIMLAASMLAACSQAETTTRDARVAPSPSTPATQPKSPPTEQANNAHANASHSAGSHPNDSRAAGSQTLTFDASSGDVPAFQTGAASLKSLPPTLSPQAFVGKQRMAYEVVGKIPQTIAQLPCYCHCDRGFGHKSLHTCFVDDHAAHCAVCVDEALMAYRLQTEERLTPEQIRERIVAQYRAAGY